MTSLFTVQYGSPIRWRAVSAIFYAGLTALSLSAALVWDWLRHDQNESMVDTLGLAAVALFSWFLAFFFFMIWAARKKLRDKGEAALVAGTDGFMYRDWRGRALTLPWEKIDCFHIIRTRGAGELFVEGQYEGAAGQPLGLDVDDFEGDSNDLLRRLEQTRMAVTRVEHGRENSLRVDKQAQVR